MRAHPCAAGYEKDQGARECLGRSNGGVTTKIHVVVDALRQALRFFLTPGQGHDITQASSLLQRFAHAHIVAEKGYDSNALIAQISEQGCLSVIPLRSARKTP
ncbi:MAG: transposase [Alphaproteobacteria bacterium]|nr:transposase [Alphaproteobacteria bacterium]